MYLSVSGRLARFSRTQSRWIATTSATIPDLRLRHLLPTVTSDLLTVWDVSVPIKRPDLHGVEREEEREPALASLRAIGTERRKPHPCEVREAVASPDFLGATHVDTRIIMGETNASTPERLSRRTIRNARVRS